MFVSDSYLFLVFLTTETLFVDFPEITSLVHNLENYNSVQQVSFSIDKKKAQFVDFTCRHTTCLAT